MSAQRSGCRNRVREVVGHGERLKRMKKIKAADVYANFALLRDPLFLAARMRCTIGFFTFCMFSKKVVILCFCKAAYEYANIGLLRDPLFLAPRMRRTIGIFTFCVCS